jgi:OOP family OmpA-OmpF porin
VYRTIALLLSGALVLALGCATTAPPADLAPVAVTAVTAGGGEQRIADQLVVITDASGTVFGSGNFPKAKAVTRSLVAALPDGQVRSSLPKPYEAASIGFGGTERITHGLAAFDRAGLASTAASLRPLGSIDGRGGETPYRHVFTETATALAGKSGRAALVIISDGLPDYEDEATASAQALVAGYSGEVCIHTVHTGDAPQGAAYLQSLAALSAGCGSSTTADALGTAAGLQSFVRTVMLGAAPVVAQASPCDQVIRLRGVEFAFDKADITEDSEVVLDVAAEQLTSCPSVRVRVEGHTDFIGSDAYNDELSQRRANAVRSYLATRGVSGGRVDAQGFGERRPIAPGRTDEDRARNRRVELHPVQ